MKYIKSAGCFSLFYVILYFILSTGMGIFITNTYLFTTLFYGILLIAAFFILRSVEMIQRRHYECIRSILVHFSRNPSCLYDPSSCRVYYYDRQFVFSRCYNQHYDTESDAESWIISFTTAFLPGLVEEILFRGVLYSRLRKANPIKGILLSALLLV